MDAVNPVEVQEGKHSDTIKPPSLWEELAGRVLVVWPDMESKRPGMVRKTNNIVVGMKHSTAFANCQHQSM
jgi:hypothetical protein